MPKQQFNLKINGKNVTAYYEPNFPSGKVSRFNGRSFATQAFEFKSKGPGPISPTGYRSHFINGTKRQLGITPKNIRAKVLKLATTMAAEYKPARGVKR